MVDNMTCITPLQLDAKQVDAIKRELPAYQAIKVSSDIDDVEFWRLHAVSMPQLSRCAQIAMLIQPSSAAAERAFSILESFSDQQQQLLEDAKEAAVMLQYNNRGGNGGVCRP